jgi:succinate-acetate transporter protein
MRKLSASVMAFALLAATAAEAKPACVLAGGEATMLTKDLAVFMATAALNNSMKDKGLKPQGAPKVTCKDPAPLTYCVAQQKACK